MIDFSTDPAVAAALDEEDPLAEMRQEFQLPHPPSGATECIYFEGNSLGPMPHRARAYVTQELDRWGHLGARARTEGEYPWTDYHRHLTEPLAELVGALPHEVVAMNALTVNLHLLMASFYRPTGTRCKVLIEQHAFPSDHFAVESQIRWHGLDPADTMVLVAPRTGENNFHTEDLVGVIDRLGEELALVLLPGIQYYTGQVLPMKEIAAAAKRNGAAVGLDLAHAVGNIELDLHYWDVDFATWCSYKYLNASSGGVSGIYVHERHVADPDIPKLTGWWGNRLETRFNMVNEFDPAPTAESWQLSNGAVLPMAALRASLEIIEEAGGISRLRAKSRRLTAYLEFLIDSLLAGRVESITPRYPEERGCQLSLKIVAPGAVGQDVFNKLEASGVACDWRYPDVIRIAPAPLYNTFSEVRRFVELLDEAIG